MPSVTRLACLLLVSLLVTSALAACQPLAAPDAAAPAATPTRVVAPVVEPDAATDWQRIEEAGRIVVGTAADFPPFSYYDTSFQVAGYDPALLRALGAALGLEVVFKDFAFEGLPGALALGQIDVAAAALTVTPERAALVDFTQPYFATSEGVLAAPGAADGSIETLDDLARRRIGVAAGTVYESWLRRALVDADLSTEGDLIRYATVEDAAADLAEGRIDLLVTDLPAAQELAAQHGLALAGQGLLAQQYALAVRPEADDLRARLDAALAALAENGTLGRLAEQHLGIKRAQLAEPSPLPDAATVEAASAAALGACTNGLAWLQDLALPDQGMTTPAVMAPAQAFTKAWRVLNTGTCTWDSSYELVFAHGTAPGASMGGQPADVFGPGSLGVRVAPGATADLTATLIAPITAGVYQGSWQMRDGEGRAFGERLRVGIQVAAVPTPTPGPTQTPVAGISFSADAERVLQGSPVTLRWDVADADEVYFSRAGQGSSNQVAAQGESTDIPQATTTYQLRVVRDGQAEDRLLTVYVEPNPDLPQIPHFALAARGGLALGDCVIITWRVEGEVEQATIFRNQETLWEDAPLAGTLEDCPEAVGEYEYAIGAQGPGGRNYAVEALRATDPAAAAEAPLAVPRSTIERFTVLPATLTPGECVDIQWMVGGRTANIQVLRDDVILLDGAPPTGSGSDCPSELGLHRYQLFAAETADQGGISVVLVVVAPPATPAPLAAESAPSPPAPAPAAPGAQTLAGHEYLLISYRNAAGELVSPLTGTQLSLVLGEDGTLSGNAGCNTYGSRYGRKDTALEVDPVEVTEMFCAEPIGLMDQEAQYLSLLPQAAIYLLEAGQLTLLDGAGHPLAIYITVQ